MAIDWTAVEELAGSLGKDALAVLKPYLPALVRSGRDVYDGFIKGALVGDWPAVNALMYEKMTVEERRQLEEQVYQNALAAVQQAWDHKQLAKEMLFKVAMGLLVKFI